MNCCEQEGVEEGAATKQRHRGVVLSLGVLGGEVAMTVVTRTTADQGEMATIVRVPDKKKQTQVINHQEAGKIHQSSLIRIILQ